jgi:Uncharacterised nucleotidyltransferase
MSDSHRAGTSAFGTDERLLLRAACAPDADARAAWMAWRSRNDPARAASNQARLLPWIFHRRDALGIDPADHHLLESLQRLLWARNQSLLNGTAALLVRLAEAGIATLCIKGLPLLRKLYPDVSLCYLADTDLMLRRDQLEPALHTLLDAGWAWIGKPLDPQHPRRIDLATLSPWEHQVPLVSPDGHACDLHWDLLRQPLPHVDEEPLWRRSEPLTVRSATTRMPSRADLLLQVLVRGCSWEKDHRPLRWVLDAHLLLEEAAIDWQGFIDETLRREAAPLVLHAIDRIREILPDAFPPVVTAALAAAPASLRARTAVAFLSNDLHHASPRVALEIFRLKHARAVDDKSARPGVVGGLRFGLGFAINKIFHKSL